MDKNAPLKKEK